MQLGVGCRPRKSRCATFFVGNDRVKEGNATGCARAGGDTSSEMGNKSSTTGKDKFAATRRQAIETILSHDANST